MEESRMKFTNRYALFVIAAVLFAASVTIFSTGAAAQEGSWQILRADFGHKELRVDVTDRLNDLLARIGPNGAIEVNTQTMGGDPAPGLGKSLRIYTKNSKNEVKEFEYNEGHAFETKFFVIRHSDWDARPPRTGDRDRDRDGDDDWNRFKIIRAYYGVQGRTVNVTELLRNRVRDGAVSFVVTNGALGGDPAVGSDKILIVIYRYQGTETATAVREGNTLSLP